jgi:hypothetical protein
MFSPLQPANILVAADAGTTVSATAAIVAAPSNLLSMLLSPFLVCFRTDPASLPESVKRLIADRSNVSE